MKNDTKNSPTAAAQSTGTASTTRLRTSVASSPSHKRGHALMTDELRRSLPTLYATETEKDPIVQVKFFSPWNGWTWYATEFDGDDIFFGLVDGFCAEWGYFSLSELDAVEGPCGVPAVERDLYFDPVPISMVKRRKAERE